MGSKKQDGDGDAGVTTHAAAAPAHDMSQAMHHQPDFIDLRIRAEFLDLCGERDTAAELRERSMAIAREVDLNCYAYQLLWRGRIEEALELLHTNAAAHPDSWNVYDSLGEVYAASGDIERAIDYYARALSMVDGQEPAARIATALSALNARRAAAQMAS